MAVLKLALAICLIVGASCDDKPENKNNHYYITNLALNGARGAYNFVATRISDFHATHIVAASTILYIANKDEEVKDAIIAAATNNNPHTKDFEDLKNHLRNKDVAASAAVLQKVLELHIKQPRNVFGGAKAAAAEVPVKAEAAQDAGKGANVVEAVKKAANSDLVKDTAQRTGMAVAFAYTQGGEAGDMAEAAATAATGMTKEQVAHVSNMMKAAVTADARTAADEVLLLFKIKLATIPDIADKLISSGQDEHRPNVEAAGHLFKAFNTLNKVELGKATDLLLGTTYIEGAVGHLAKFINKENLQSLFPNVPTVRSLWPFGRGNKAPEKTV